MTKLASEWVDNGLFAPREIENNANVKFWFIWSEALGPAGINSSPVDHKISQHLRILIGDISVFISLQLQCISFFLLTSLDSARSRDHPPKELGLLGENPSTRLSECIHMTSRRQYSCSKTVSIRSHRPQPLSPLMKCTQWNGGHIGVGLLGFLGKKFLLLSLICMDACHVSEYALY